VYKPVRTNMPVKILLKLGEEEIMSLDRSYNFSPEQIQQLKDFKVGQGMLMEEEPHWPIQWRGARCGLGLGDGKWKDRYAEAWGARVIDSFDKQQSWLNEYGDRDYYINARTGRIKPVDREAEQLPDLGEWFVFPSDIFAHVPTTFTLADLEPPDKIDRRLVETALEGRRDVPIPSDLSLQRVDRKTHRSLSFESGEEADKKERRQILNQNDVPKPLEGLIGANVKQTRQNMLTVIEEIDKAGDGDLNSMADLAEVSGIPKGTIGRWRTRRKDFPQMLDKKDGEWVLTATGRRALKIEWAKLDRIL